MRGGMDKNCRNTDLIVIPTAQKSNKDHAPMRQASFGVDIGRLEEPDLCTIFLHVWA
jgi:hypothetical protein